MTPERWQQIKQCFDQVLSLPETEQERFLRQHCRNDPDLKQAVQRLLRHNRAQTTPLRQVLAAELEDYLDKQFSIRPGEQLGSYRLRRMIGAGGMGVVYLAERSDDQFRQQVAIKLIHQYSINQEALQRFATERQILASLQHPNIAHLLDGGTTEQGLPYLVMEYIDGQPLLDYCRDQLLDTGQRLRLVEQVCTSVEYAHRNLVVHRDIKPANILVDRNGDIKLLDFGIAKILQGKKDPFDPDLETGTALRLLTPENAAPEQITGEAITTATDIYALGNLLYQLLCEEPQFDLEACNRLEIEQLICEQMPARPSQRIGNSHSLIRSGRHSPRSLSRRLAGDLDTIALTALKKEPHRRYSDVSRLREDLQRHREHFPIRARADSLAYRGRRLIRRHRISAALAAGLILSSITFVAALLIQSRQLEQQTRSARLEAATAHQASAFLIDVFEAADPNLNSGKPATADDLLESGEEKIDQLDDQPELQAVMLKTLGQVFQRIGNYEKARDLQQRAFEHYQNLPATRITARADMLATLADLHFELGEYARSADEYRGSIELFLQGNPVDETGLHWSYSGLSSVLAETGDLEQAISLDRKVLAWKLENNPPLSLEAAEAYNRLGHSLRRNGQLDEAAVILQQGLTAMRASRGNQHLDTAHSLNQLARTLDMQGKQREALQLAREGLEIRRSIHRQPHPEVIASIGNVANILASLKRFDEAITLRRDGLRQLQSLFGEEHSYVLGFRSSLGTLLRKQGERVAAQEQYRKALDIARRILPPDQPRIAFPLTGLGIIAREDGNLQQARLWLQEAYDLRRKGLPEDNYRIATSGYQLGLVWFDLGDYSRAEPLLLEAHRLYQATFGAAHETTRAISSSLARLYDRLGQPDRANLYRL